MSTSIAIQITPQGILIPNTAIHNWGEIEAVREKNRIIIQPKFPSPRQERLERIGQLLHAALADVEWSEIEAGRSER